MLPTKFVNQPSECLKCPLCKDLFTDPVISTQCGHTFCRQCIQVGGSSSSLSIVTKCPFDGISLKSSSLVSNLAVKAQIEDLLIYCRHGLTRSDSEEDFEIDREGCPETITIGKRLEHEEVCEWGIVPCPNSSNQCGKFRRRELDEHLKVCSYYKCQFNAKGCPTTGTKEQIEQHLKTCSHRNGHDIKTVSNLQNEGELKTTIQRLTERVTWLEKNQDALVTQVERCNSTISRLTDNVEELSYQVEVLGSMVKRSSFYRDLSVSSIPDTVNNMSPDESVPHSPRRMNQRMRQAVVPVQQEAWVIPCIFKCIGTLRGHRSVIWSMVSKGHRLFSAGGDRVIKVWNMENVRLARCTASMEGHTNDIHTLCTGGGRLYSAGSDQMLISWDLDTLTQHVKVENAHDDIICAAVYSGKYLFTSSHSCIKVWDSSTLDLVHTIDGLNHWVRALALDDKREKLFSGSHNVVHFWDATGTFDLRTKIDHTFGSVYSLAVTKQYLIVGTYNQNIHVYDINTHQHIKALTGHFGTVTGLVLSVSGRLLFSASYDTTVQVWNLESMLPMQTLSRHEASVNCVVVHKDLLLSGSQDTEIKVFKYFKME